jgi:hypothetical protein
MDIAHPVAGSIVRVVDRLPDEHRHRPRSPHGRREEVRLSVIAAGVGHPSEALPRETLLPDTLASGGAATPAPAHRDHRPAQGLPGDLFEETLPAVGRHGGDRAVGGEGRHGRGYSQESLMGFHRGERQRRARARERAERQRDADAREQDG